MVHPLHTYDSVQERRKCVQRAYIAWRCCCQYMEPLLLNMILDFFLSHPKKVFMLRCEVQLVTRPLGSRPVALSTPMQMFSRIQLTNSVLIFLKRPQRDVTDPLHELNVREMASPAGALLGTQGLFSASSPDIP